MFDAILEKTNEILTNNFTFILIDIILNSFMAFLGIITYGKTKKASSLFFVLAALFLYISMIIRVLDRLNILKISEFKYFNQPVFQYIFEYIPILLIIFAFLTLIKNKEE